MSEPWDYTIGDAREAAENLLALLREAEAVLRDARGEAAVFKRFSEAVRTAVSPPSDIHVSSDYRRALIGLLAERVTAVAWTRAAGGAQ